MELTDKKPTKPQSGIGKKRPLQNPSYKEIKIMNNAVNQFITNCHFLDVLQRSQEFYSCYNG